MGPNFEREYAILEQLLADAELDGNQAEVEALHEDLNRLADAEYFETSIEEV